jgi:hypothetical protein
MALGCFGRANPWPIRLEFRRMASKRFSSVEDPVSRVSPAWKRNGMSSPRSLHSARNARSSGTNFRIGKPASSPPTRS